jgi:hypothetical protein
VENITKRICAWFVDVDLRETNTYKFLEFQEDSSG